MEGHHGLGTDQDNAGGKCAGEVEEAELGQAAGNLRLEAGERPANSNACCICHEPWACCGAHRICCIPCGHVYGGSCLEMWLIRSGCREAKCLWCEKQFKREDIFNLYGTTEHLWDGRYHDQAARQVAAEEDEEARWQVTNAVMEQLVTALARENAGIIARERAEVVRERLDAIRENLEVARRNEEGARRNVEIARQNLVGGQLNEAMFALLVILLLFVVLLYYNL